MRLIRQHGAFETRIASQHASRCTPMIWDTNSFDPVTTEGFMPEMGVLP